MIEYIFAFSITVRLLGFAPGTSLSKKKRPSSALVDKIQASSVKIFEFKRIVVALCRLCCTFFDYKILNSAILSPAPLIFKTGRETFISPGCSMFWCLSRIPDCPFICNFFESFGEIQRLDTITAGFCARTAINGGFCIVVSVLNPALCAIAFFIFAIFSIAL